MGTATRQSRILILCTGNSCRSQMAEAYLKSLDTSLLVASAGTEPAERVHPKAVQVMKEAGIDLSTAKPKNVSSFLNQAFDYVITVCDHAKETCPVFTGEVKEHLHMGYSDPAKAAGSEEEVLSVFRRVRDEIMRDFRKFYERRIKS